MKRSKPGFFLVFLLLITPAYLFSQVYTDERSAYPKLKLDLPLFDFPYQVEATKTVGYGFFGSYANPGMSQSLAATTDLISGFHFGMKYLNDNLNVHWLVKQIIYVPGIILGDYVLTYLPGGDGWLHEEFHRAVMTLYGMNSFNEMNLFPMGAGIVSVSRVEDAGFIRLKEKSPSDLVRLHAAGIEGEYLLMQKLQRNNFIYDQNLPNFYVYWMSTINSQFYIFASSQPDMVDVDTALMNEKETTIASRDFTGYDMTAWVYDLFRPDEPYAARGIHPSGVGINRYRTTKDLTDEELAYLRKQTYWNFLNYLSPMLFTNRSIPIGKNGLTGNFAMRHMLTSFGTVVSAQMYFKYKPYNMIFTYHSYLNYEHYFPAIEAELVDYPFSIGKLGLYLSPRIMIGMQPEDQKFKTATPEFFGLLGLRSDFIVSRYFFPYMEFTAKTDGWVAGNEYLNKNLSIRLGISARF